MGKNPSPQTRKIIKEDTGKNKILLIGAAVGILVVILLIVFATGKKKTNTTISSAPPTRQISPARSKRTNHSIKKTKSALSPKVASIRRPETPEGVRELYANARTFLQQYDKLAAKGKWLELAKLAKRKGLFVESHYCGSAAGYSNIRKRFYRSLILLQSNAGYALVTQAEFEKTYTIDTNTLKQNPQLLAEELDDIKSVSGIASQTRFADLLIKIDTAHGRELFKENIKNPKFYSILIRELNRIYLSRFSNDNIFQAKWYSPEPMNLWLIQQLINMDVSKIASIQEKKTEKSAQKTKKTKKRKRRRRRPSRTPEPNMMEPPMGPMESMGPAMPGMMMPGAQNRASLNLAPEQKKIYEHKKLILNLLTKRGGILSAYLIGQLLKSDKENLIIQAISAGQISPSLFMRFTGIYAEPLIPYFEKALLNIKGSQAEWNSVAAILARMHNDRAAYAVFSAARKSTMKIQADVAFALAAGARQYTLDTLEKFIKVKQIEDCPIETLFTLWTSPQKDSYTKLWDWLSEWIPGLSTPDISVSGKRVPANLNKQMPVPPEMAGPMPPGAMPDEMMGMPPERQTRRSPVHRRRSKRALSRMRKQKSKSAPKKGWPIKRHFVRIVNKNAILAFLEETGKIQISTPKQEHKAQDTKHGKGRTHKKRKRIKSAVTVSANSLASIKRSAVRCLLNVATQKHSTYFRSLIDDELVGGLARLGLCLLDDKQSAEKLLAHFWTHPLELADFVTQKGKSSKNKQQSQIITDVNVSAAKLAVPLNEDGLTQCGISARSALIYFDYSPAGKAFLSALGEFILHKEPFDEPARVAGAVCQIIEAIGNWNVPDSTRTLADLIASAGDFGLRGTVRRIRSARSAKNSLATAVRAKALEVLGRIGDRDALNIIVQLATFPQADIYLQTAARIALARRGAEQATELFLNMLDPDKKQINRNRNRKNVSQLIREIAPDLQTEEDVALLGISRLPKIDPLYMQQAIELIKKLGTSKQITHRGSHSQDIQERYVLSLLSIGQGAIIDKIADIIELTALEPLARRGNLKSPYYWNRLTGEARDKAFLYMIKTLANKKQFNEPNSVVRLIKAILKREQEIFEPNEQILEEWNPEKYLIKFEYSHKQISRGLPNIGFGEPGFPGMQAPEMPGISKIIKRGRRSSKNRGKSLSNKSILSIPFPASLDQKNIPQLAVAAGLELITKLPNAKRYIKEFNNGNKFPLYRYHANFIFYKKGLKSARKNLVAAFANPGKDTLQQYFEFLAIDQMTKSQDPELVGIFGQAASESAKSVIIHKLIDGGLYVITKLFDKQVAGEITLLDRKSIIIPIAQPWETVISTSRYDGYSDSPLIIMLSGMQIYTPTIEWIDEIILKQCKNDFPVSEQALINAVTILHSLNPAGNKELLKLYLDILSSKIKSQAITAKSSQIPQFEGQPDRKVSRRTRTAARKSQYSFTYNAVCPLIIRAIGEMTAVETLSVLKKLTKERPDMLGLIAIEIYKKDIELGKKLIISAIKASSKNPQLAGQIQTIIGFLMNNPPTPFCYEAITLTIIVGDSSSAKFCLDILEKQLLNNKFPKQLDVPVMFRSILQGLVAQIRTSKDAVSKLDKAIEIAKHIKSHELKKVIENIEKYRARLKRTPKRSERSRGNSRRRRRR